LEDVGRGCSRRRLTFLKGRNLTLKTGKEFRPFARNCPAANSFTSDAVEYIYLEEEEWFFSLLGGEPGRKRDRSFPYHDARVEGEEFSLRLRHQGTSSKEGGEEIEQHERIRGNDDGRGRGYFSIRKLTLLKNREGTREEIEFTTSRVRQRRSHNKKTERDSVTRSLSQKKGRPSRDFYSTIQEQGNSKK